MRLLFALAALCLVAGCGARESTPQPLAPPVSAIKPVAGIQDIMAHMIETQLLKGQYN